MSLERDLQNALRRTAPDPGFSARVLARIDQGDWRADVERPSRHRWRAVAASLAFVAVVGGYTTHHVLEVRRGERAKEQVLLAMRIASEKVSAARQEVRDIGSHP